MVPPHPYSTLFPYTTLFRTQIQKMVFSMAVPVGEQDPVVAAFGCRGEGLLTPQGLQPFPELVPGGPGVPPAPDFMAGSARGGQGHAAGVAPDVFLRAAGV